MLDVVPVLVPVVLVSGIVVSCGRTYVPGTGDMLVMMVLVGKSKTGANEQQRSAIARGGLRFP